MIRQPRAAAASMPASHNVVLPMPASPGSTATPGSCSGASSNWTIAASSSSLPTRCRAVSATSLTGLRRCAFPCELSEEHVSQVAHCTDMRLVHRRHFDDLPVQELYPAIAEHPGVYGEVVLLERPEVRYWRFLKRIHIESGATTPIR